MAAELSGSGEMTTKATTATGAVVKEPVTRVYVNFLAGNGDLWKGVVELARGLRMVGTAYPLVVAVLPDVPESLRRILVSQGCIVREVEPVYPPENEAHLAMADYVVKYSKLRIREFVEYERMVFLDAGIKVPENIDELFELEKGHFYAAATDCVYAKMSSGHTPQYKIGPPPATYFNAGMFVHEPSMATTEALVDALRVTPPTSFAEQGPWAEKLQPLFGSWLPTKKGIFSRQNVPAMATLAASTAAVGVVTNAADPAICFCFYALFVAAIAAVTISLHGI